MAINFEKLGDNVVRKEPVQPSGPPKQSREIRPYLAERDREEHLKRTGTEMSPKHFGIWLIRTEVSRKPVEAAEALLLQEQINGAEGEDDKRFIHVEAIPQKELRHKLPWVYEGYGLVSANQLPDLVIIEGGQGYHYDSAPPEDKLAQSYIHSETGPIREIREAADRTLYPEFSPGKFLRNDDWHTEFIMTQLNKRGNDIETTKMMLSQELALDYLATDLFKSDADWEMAGKTFDEYARTGDEAALSKIVTPGRVRMALNASVSRKNHVREAYLRKRDQYKKETGFLSETECLEQYDNLVAIIQKLASEKEPDELRENIAHALKKIATEQAPRYLADREYEASERRLLQPLIVSIAPSAAFQEAALRAGADMILPSLPDEELKKLVTLANRIRTSPASVASERLRRNKHEFYRSVVEEVEKRAEQTADTEREVEILHSLFEHVSAKKVLDVGAGYGRLAFPLAEKGYNVTGLEANRKFLEKAKKKKGNKRNLHYKKGDLVDFKKDVKADSYDAVYYGWHSFLEAYGLGNTLSTLHSARSALKPGGVLTFDQPSRENPGMEEGWYGHEEDGYVAYLMDEEEIKFLLKATGFEDVHFLKWISKPSELYPKGMKKISVVARKIKKKIPNN